MKKKRSLLRIIIVMLLVGVTCLIFYRMRGFGSEPVEKAQEEADSIKKNRDELAERPFFYPEHLYLDQDVGNLYAVDQKGKEVPLAGEKPRVIIFWGSWCNSCKRQLEIMDSLNHVAGRYDAEILLVERFDEEKESREQVLGLLREMKITNLNYFDRDSQISDALGLKQIPTALVIDENGKAVFCYPNVIEGASALDSMLRYALEKREKALADMLDNHMLMDNGGMRTGLGTNASGVPADEDVLSESQGILMEYALLSGNREVFQKSFQFLEQKMKQDGLYAWYSSGDQKAFSNATLDDLRIYRILNEAEQKWGGYTETVSEMGKALEKYIIKKGLPVDFYDFQSRKASKDFSLCYADFEALSLLEKNRDITGLTGEVLEIVEEGYISDSFPFYYSSYSYETKKYSEKDLNMAEAMYTLYHLAKVGKLKESSIKWLEDSLWGNGIMAKYRTDGTVAPMGGYESTGIYALAALIGLETGNPAIYTPAIERMESFRIFDRSSSYDGGFGNPNGTGFYSFDQCMALLCYAKMANMPY